MKYAVLPTGTGIVPVIASIEPGRECHFADCKIYGSWEEAHEAILMSAKVAHHSAMHYVQDVLAMKNGR